MAFRVHVHVLLWRPMLWWFWMLWWQMGTKSSAQTMLTHYNPPIYEEIWHMFNIAHPPTFKKMKLLQSSLVRYLKQELRSSTMSIGSHHPRNKSPPSTQRYWHPCAHIIMCQNQAGTNPMLAAGVLALFLAHYALYTVIFRRVLCRSQRHDFKFSSG